MITASFGSKKFNVSSSKIYTPDGTAISEEIEFDEKEVKGKKPEQTFKSIKLQSMSFDIKLDVRFVTIETELRWWKNKLLAHSSDIFILGGCKIGKFYLQKYDLKDVVINKKGVYVKATLSLTFVEDGYYANRKRIVFESTAKANKVKNSKNTSKTKKSEAIKVGTKIKPKSGVRWYYTAKGAINRTGTSGKAYNEVMEVSYVYNNGEAINPKGLGWLRPEDVDIV